MKELIKRAEALRKAHAHIGHEDPAADTARLLADLIAALTSKKDKPEKEANA